MVSDWPMVPLGEILTKSEEWIEIQPDGQYRQVTVRLWGGGVVLRNEVSGTEISAKRRLVVRSQQFILSRIDARNGAFGLVPDSLDGAVVSNDFPSFNTDRTRILPRFLEWMSKTRNFVDLCRAASEGTTNRVRLKIDRFLATKAPLPPLNEQRRIVARIEKLAALIGEAHGLRVKAREEAEALPFEAFQELLDKGIVNGWAVRPLSEVCEVNPSRKGRTSYPDDMQVSFVPMSAVDDATGSIAWPEIRSFSEVKRGYKWFLEGDVIFARITPCMQNGKSAIARKLANGVGFGSTEFHVLRPEEEITAEWMHRIVRQPSFRRDAEASFKGSAGQQRVPQTFLEAYEIPVPTVDEQHHIVTYLDDLQAQVDELTALQDATQAELDVLLPSVLDRAFRGEL
jgi:type I restriction enzyme S subunit